MKRTTEAIIYSAMRVGIDPVKYTPSALEATASMIADEYFKVSGDTREEVPNTDIVLWYHNRGWAWVVQNRQA